MVQVGKYEVIRKLATGGMAEVFLARAAGPMGFQKQVVLKRILPHLAEDAQFVDMFLSEARLAAQLNHPNIVQIYDFGMADGVYFIAMEYVDGPNLRHLLERSLARSEPLPLPVCARLVSEACEGLAYAHEFADPVSNQPLNLVHRDVSLDNLLISLNGTLKVVDFGVAKAQNQSHRTQSGVIKGKLGYMPPEQIEGKVLDRRVDVYALGVVLHELMTGRRPFEGSSDVAVMQAILFQPLKPVRELRADIPESLERVLNRALQRDPTERFQSCRELQDGLEEYIATSGARVGAYRLAKWVAHLSESSVPTPGPQVQSAMAGTHETERTLVKPALGPEAPAPEEKGGGLPAPAVLARPEEKGLTGPVHGLTPAPAPGPSRVQPLAVEAAAPGGGGDGTPGPGKGKGRRLVVAAGAVAVVVPLALVGFVRAGAPKPRTPLPPVASSAPEAPRPLVPPQAPALAPPPAVDSTPGTVVFRVFPYATVSLDGRPLGETPLAPLVVPPGPHEVRLVNAKLHRDVVVPFAVKPGASNIFKYNLKTDGR